MKENELNIKTDDEKFIITIRKEDITPVYLLKLLNWLQFHGNLIFNLNKDAEKDEKQTTCEHRNWKYAGSINLNHKIDNINLRDFAYE